MIPGDQFDLEVTGATPSVGPQHASLSSSDTFMLDAPGSSGAVADLENSKSQSRTSNRSNLSDDVPWMSHTRWQDLELSLTANQGLLDEIKKLDAPVEYNFTNPESFRVIEAGPPIDEYESGTSCWEVFKHFLNHQSVQRYVFMLLLAFSGSLLAVVHHEAGLGLARLRLILVDSVEGEGGNSIEGYLVYTASALFFGFLTAATTRWLSSSAAGSGVPEMKLAIAGVSMPRTLSERCMVAKLLGLLTGQAAGLEVGKEGPFVHIGGCVATLLLKLPYFRHLSQGKRYIQMMMCAAATGFAANFGAPIGAVLFTIEVTCTYYPVGNLWQGFFVSTHVLLFLRMFRHFGGRGDYIALFPTDLPEISFGRGATWVFFLELTIFMLIGALGGILGALMVSSVKRLVTFRLKHMSTWHFSVVMGTVLLYSVLTYPFKFLHLGFADQIGTFFSSSELDPAVWGSGSAAILRLVCWCIRKLFTCCISFVLPIPVGVYTPTFALGAGLGRLFGEAMNALFPNLLLVPAAYSVVAAAALTSGLTRTLSTTIMVFELTGQMRQSLPVLSAVVMSVMVGKWFNHSIFDTILRLRRLPYLFAEFGERLKFQGRTLYVADIMDKDVKFVRTSDSIEDIEMLLFERYRQFPLVEDGDHPYLIGSVTRQDLQKVLDEYGKGTYEGITRTAKNSIQFEMVADTSRGGLPEDPLDLSVTLREHRDSANSAQAGINPGRAKGIVRTFSAPLMARLKTIAQGNTIQRRHMEHFRFSVDGMPLVQFNAAALQTTPFLSIKELQQLITSMGTDHMLVTFKGCLHGVVTKRTLIKLITLSNKVR